MIEDIQLFKNLTVDGTLKTYSLGDKVIYRDRVFVLTSNFLKLAPGTYATSIFENGTPSESSKYWTEVPLPSRLSITKTEPTGPKLIGDRWFNPITELLYIYTKINNTQYGWLCG